MAGNLHLHLLDITVKLSVSNCLTNIDTAISEVKQRINDGVRCNRTATGIDFSKSEHGKVISAFKIVGESRIIAVLDGGIEGVCKQLYNYFVENIDVKCTPLRTYEQFAARVLKVEEYKSLPPPTHSLQNPNNPSPRYYWLQFDVGYRGRTFEQLMAIWGREASTALAVRKSGTLVLDMYKSVGQQQVHVFVNGPDEETMDDLTFTLPAMVEMGDEVHITTKSLLPL